MKKKILYLLPVLLLLGACGGNSSSNNTTTSSVAPSTTVDPAQVGIEILNASRVSPSYREEVIIMNGTTRVYYSLERKEFDTVNNIELVAFSESGIGGLDSSSPTFSSTTTVYYDGTHSYSLGSDNFYTKEECSKTLSTYTYNFNFSVLKNAQVTTSGASNTMTATIDDSDVSTFFNKTLSGVTSFAFQAQYSSDRTNSFLLTYVQNGLSVRRQFQYTYVVSPMSLPSNIN